MSRRSQRKWGASPLQEAVQACEAQKDNSAFFRAVHINDYIGYGVFAMKNFLKGDFLLEYAGEVIPLQEASKRERKYPREKGSFMFFFNHNGDTKCVDATNHTDRLGRLVNDSQCPNSKMKVITGTSGTPFLCLFALKDIRKGDELIYDYGVPDLPWRHQTFSSCTSEKRGQNQPWTCGSNLKDLEKGKCASSSDVQEEVTSSSGVGIEVQDNRNREETFSSCTSEKRGQNQPWTCGSNLKDLEKGKCASSSDVQEEVTSSSGVGTEVQDNRNREENQPSPLDKDHQKPRTWYDDDYNPFEDMTLYPHIYCKESSKVISCNENISSDMSLSKKGYMENGGVEHPEKDGRQYQSRESKECQEERFDHGAEKTHSVADYDADDEGFVAPGLTEDRTLVVERNGNCGKDAKDFLTESDEYGGSTDDSSHNDSDIAACSDSNESNKEEQCGHGSVINGGQASIADTGEEKTCNVADEDSDEAEFVVEGLTEDGSVILKKIENCSKDPDDFLKEFDIYGGSTDDDSSDNDFDIAACSDSNGSKREEQSQDSSAVNGEQASVADTCGERTCSVADDDSDGMDYDFQGLSEEHCPIGDSSESGDDSTSEYTPEDDEYQGTSDNDLSDSLNERDSPHGEMIEPDSTQLDSCEIADLDDETRGPSNIIPLPTSSMRKSYKSQRDTPTSKASLEPSKKCEVSSTTGTRRSGVKIMVSNRANGQNWDKYQYCVYCLQPKAKLARHFQTMHSDEIEVQEAFSFDKKSAERKSRLRVLTNKGNHAHNLEVLKANSGVIIPYKRPTHNVPVEDYIPCERCFGYFVGSDMWKHLKSCPVTKSVSGRNNGLQSRCSLLLPLPVEVDDCFKASVLAIMRRDDVSIVCRNDPLILTLGQRLFSSLDKESHNMQYISQKMREMGRLLQAIKAENPSIDALDQCLQPSCFDMVVKAVRVCAGYNSSTQKYSTPSLALKLGHSLKKCSGFVKINGIKTGNDIVRNNAERFEQLCNLEWSSMVSSHALTTLSQRKWNKPTILPLSEDIVKLHKHLSMKMTESKEMLSTAPDKLAWNTLASATLSKVILFNRRRSGEVQRIHRKDYESCHGHSSNDVFEGLTNWEQKLCQGLSRVEIKGKRGRKVPILLTSEMREALDALVTSRELVGVCEENTYLFARPSLGSTTPLRGSDCLSAMAIESKAQNPSALTSTKLRKHIATVSQLFCLKNHELDILANFLGHDIRVHREYYRLPDDTLQMTKVARLLLAMEKGNTTSFKDKQLKDIEVPLDEPCTSEEEDGDVDDDHDVSAVNDEGSQEESDKDETERIHTKEAGKKKSRSKPSQRKQRDTKNVKSSNSRMRRPWSTEKTEDISRFFKKDIRLGRVPRKGNCEECQRELALKDRTWKDIKYKVYSLIQAYNRKKH